MNLSGNEHQRAIESKGWTIIEDVLSSSECDRLRDDCLRWITTCEKLQVMNGVNASGDGTGHHTIGGGDSIDAFIDKHTFHEFFTWYFSGMPYILHACNPVGGAPAAKTYVHRIHRDVATYIHGFNLRINVLVMLDDFRVENGATHVLNGSHKLQQKPTEEEFENAYSVVTGTRGSVVLFNSYLWHRGGMNNTARNRVALTMSFGPAFVKPQLDYARMLGDEYGNGKCKLSRQVLGYNSRVPVSREEFYQPPEKRLYRADQG